MAIGEGIRPKPAKAAGRYPIDEAPQTNCLTPTPGNSLTSGGPGNRAAALRLRALGGVVRRQIIFCGGRTNSELKKKPQFLLVA